MKNLFLIVFIATSAFQSFAGPTPNPSRSGSPIPFEDDKSDYGDDGGNSGGTLDRNSASSGSTPPASAPSPAHPIEYPPGGAQPPPPDVDGDELDRTLPAIDPDVTLPTNLEEDPYFALKRRLNDIVISTLGEMTDIRTITQIDAWKAEIWMQISQGHDADERLSAFKRAVLRLHITRNLNPVFWRCVPERFRSHSSISLIRDAFLMEAMRRGVGFWNNPQAVQEFLAPYFSNNPCDARTDFKTGPGAPGGGASGGAAAAAC